jgi:hypothetical protein
LRLGAGPLRFQYFQHQPLLQLRSEIQMRGSRKRGTEDLDFFIGDEALAAGSGPGYGVNYPIRHGPAAQERGLVCDWGPAPCASSTSSTSLCCNCGRKYTWISLSATKRWLRAVVQDTALTTRSDMDRLRTGTLRATLGRQVGATSAAAQERGLVCDWGPAPCASSTGYSKLGMCRL